MEGRRYSGETKIEKTRKWMEGRRYRGRVRDSEDKKGNGRQKIQGERPR
jgi:hypothetical protein